MPSHAQEAELPPHRRRFRRHQRHDQDDGLTLRILPLSARSSAGEVWRYVEATAPDVPPFARWDWTELWLEHYGAAVPHEYVVVERDGVPRGVALLTRSSRSRGPITVRRLHVGTAGEPGDGVFVEYNGLCAPSTERAAMACVLLAHVHRTPGWDELHLDGFDPAHAVHLLSAEPRCTIAKRASRLLELDSASDDLVDTLPSKSARATVRRSLRGITPYTTEWAGDGARALAIFDDLERLHQERWRARGEPGVFASGRFRSFHRQLIQLWVPDGRAVVFAVRQADQTIAALYGFVVGDTLQFYQGGFRMSEHNKVRVGHASHMLLAAAARAHGLREYEYLVGDHRYKTELSTSERTIVWASLVRRRPRAMAIHAGRATGQALRKRITGMPQPAAADDGN